MSSLDTESELQVTVLKAALRAAILSTHRVSIRCIEFGHAVTTYEINFTPEVQRWAALCDLDLNQHDPSRYGMKI